MQLGRFVVTRDISHAPQARASAPAAASVSVILRSLQDAARVARLDTFQTQDAAQATGAEVFEVLLAVKGPWQQKPSHAVYAVWDVQDAPRAAAFVESRRQLFTLRQQVLPTFAADWLLKHHEQEGRYMVLGFYGDEEGASRLCREHPQIRQFAAAHPASDYGAVDQTGLLCWRIEHVYPGEGSA